MLVKWLCIWNQLFLCSWRLGKKEEQIKLQRIEYNMRPWIDYKDNVSSEKVTCRLAIGLSPLGVMGISHWWRVILPEARAIFTVALSRYHPANSKKLQDTSPEGTATDHPRLRLSDNRIAEGKKIATHSPSAAAWRVFEHNNKNPLEKRSPSGKNSWFMSSIQTIIKMVQDS